MIKGLKVFGLRRSGNNYLMHLIDLNMKLQYTTRERFINKGMGWTHGAPHDVVLNQDRFKDIGIVCIIKNPYSWALSFYRNPVSPDLARLFKMSFEGAIQMPIEGYDDMFDMWSKINYTYSTLMITRGAYIIRYEDLLKDPQVQIDRIMAKWKIKKSKEYFTDIGKKIIPTGEITPLDFKHKLFYLNEKWKPHISDNAKNLIDKRLDEKLVKSFKYEII